MEKENKTEKQPDYSGTIVSPGIVFAVPDKYMGVKYRYGIPPWRKKRNLELRKRILNSRRAKLLLNKP